MTCVESVDIRGIISSEESAIVMNNYPRIIIPVYNEQYITISSIEYIVFTQKVINVQLQTEDQLINYCSDILPVVTSDLTKFLMDIIKSETTYIYPTIFVSYALSYIHKHHNRSIHKRIIFDSTTLLMLRLWANQFRKLIADRIESNIKIVDVRSFTTSELYIGCYICNHILRFIKALGY